MIRALVTGRLHGEPQQRTGQSGKPYVTAGVWVDVEAEQRTWCSCIAFGSAAERLMQLRAGDAVSLAGKLTPKVYAKPGADPRVSLDLVVDEVAAVRRKPRDRKPDQRDDGDDPFGDV